MTKMRINLMPRPPRAETIERMKKALIGAYKVYIYYLKNENEARKEENEAQAKLIEMYRTYFDLMERRYPVERWPKSESGSAQPTMEERKAYAKSLLEE